MAAIADLPTTRVLGRPVTDEDRVRWVRFYNLALHQEPMLLPYLELHHKDLHRQAIAMLEALAVEAKSAEWRSPNPKVGARPEQLLPGTAGSFSDRTDWVTWLLMGGRGSGKTRAGAEAVREILLEREWREPPMGALVGQRLDSVRTDMCVRTLLEIMPPRTVRIWRRSTVEVVLYNGGYLRGFSSEAARNLRGGNFHFAWADELGTWFDANRSPRAVDTTWSNMIMAVRLHDHHTWVPRVIGTTTPRVVKLLRNQDPTDVQNPGLGLYDDPRTVVSNMSTEANLANLADHYLTAIIEPLIGTRLYDQEVRGLLLDEAIGAQWTDEQIRSMIRHPGAQDGEGKGLWRVVVAVDPSVGAGLGDECGIVVAGLGADGRVWVLEDLSIRAPAKVWVQIVREAFVRWGASAVVVETNQGGELLREVLGRDDGNLPIQEVWGKRGKMLRAEPVALLTDRGRVRFAGGEDRFGKLWFQMKTWDGTGDSPDRLDAFVYACLWLLPVDTGAGALVNFGRAGATR